MKRQQEKRGRKTEGLDVSLETVGNGKAPSRKSEWIGFTVFGLALVLFVIFCAGGFPIVPVTVATGSMEPSIRIGDVVLVDSVTPEELQEGDVIRYRKDTYTVIHRITEILETEDGGISFRTQGDANNAPDTDPVLWEQVEGRVILTVPKVGLPTVWLHQWLSS